MADLLKVSYRVLAPKTLVDTLDGAAR